MAHILDEAEDLMYTWIMTLPTDEQKELHNGADIINCINEEAEEEIKNEIWESIKNSVSYRAILNRLKIHLDEVIETQEEEEEEEVNDQASTYSEEDQHP